MRARPHEDGERTVRTSKCEHICMYNVAKSRGGGSRANFASFKNLPHVM